MEKAGAKGESNPRPLAPKARIIPLDHWPTCTFKSTFGGARTRDHRIKSPALYHLSYEGSRLAYFNRIGCVAQRQSIGLQILWSAVRIRSYPFWILKIGAKGESNPRPLAPEARIIPLDHWPML